MSEGETRDGVVSHSTSQPACLPPLITTLFGGKLGLVTNDVQIAKVMIHGNCVYKPHDEKFIQNDFSPFFGLYMLTILGTPPTTETQLSNSLEKCVSEDLLRQHHP